MLALVVLLLAAIVPAQLVAWLLGLIPFGIVGVAIVASSLLAQRSLGAHVAAVATALETGGLAEGRKAVSMIVGRDPERLDEAGVSRAAIESLAENFSDGVVAPAFWLAIGGLPAAAAYKAVNTADSMIGHRSKRHQAFGWAAARFDDLINLPASRLSALLIVAARLLPSRRLGRRMPGAPCCATPESTARRMPAGRKRRWPARSACRWPARATMAACWSTMPRWAPAAGATPMPPTSAARWRSTAPPMLILVVADRPDRRGCHRACAMSRSRSMCFSRCAASASSVASTPAS